VKSKVVCCGLIGLAGRCSLGGLLDSVEVLKLPLELFRSLKSLCLFEELSSSLSFLLERSK